MTSEDGALLHVLAEAGGPLPARDVAAKVAGCTREEAIASGLSVRVAKRLCTMASVAGGGLVQKDYPYGCTYVAYTLSAAGSALVVA